MKTLSCPHCKKKTEHIPTGFRKPLNKQLYRCEVCKEERYE